MADSIRIIGARQHNLDVIRHAGWIIDLGPDGSRRGGGVIAEGTPEDIATEKRSHTGQYLRRLLREVAATSGQAALRPRASR